MCVISSLLTCWQVAPTFPVFEKLGEEASEIEDIALYHSLNHYIASMPYLLSSHFQVTIFSHRLLFILQHHILS